MYMERYHFDFKKLLDYGIVFITQAHDLSTGKKIAPEYDKATGEYYEDSTNLITLFNIKNPVAGEQDHIMTALRSPRPDMAQDWTSKQENLTDGKYNQILWGINHKNMRPEDFVIDKPQKDIRRINDIISGQDAYKQNNTTDSNLYDTQRFPTHESLNRMKQLMKLICEERDPYDNVVRIYPNGEGSDLGDNIPTWGIEEIKIKDAIPNEPFKDLSYMDSSENAKAMINSIKKNEKLPPIKVIKHPYAPEKFLVVDGNHRRHAYERAGAETIPANIINPQDVLLMTKSWGSKDNKGISLSKVNDENIIDKYFVKPNGVNTFLRSPEKP